MNRTSLLTSRRRFFVTSSAATLAASHTLAHSASFVAPAAPRTRVLVASSAPDGILAYDWNPQTGELASVGVAASVPKVAWIAFSPGREFVYSASELDMFEGKPTGEVASFRLANGGLEPLSARNSASIGTCHVEVDHTGQMLLAADYVGASAASFRIRDGKLSEPVWTEHYTVHGPNPDRQKTAHAHFASFSPDNRFAYINDLGGDCIHIYKPDLSTAQMAHAGIYHGAPGSGARTLRFHPNGHTAYCMNELASTVDVLAWHKSDGSLTLVARIDLLPADYHGPTRGCDTVITRDGRFVYFANRDDNFLYSFNADFSTGALTPITRSSCGGKTPRSFTLDPTERWMLVANQDSNWISIFARDPATGKLADEGRNVPALAPMCMLFA
ncbi:MAG TPA: lactonase family protein [Terracidiphilus sp.]|nr:lactonase family protein [Terracidiphilus sp.]